MALPIELLAFAAQFLHRAIGLRVCARAHASAHRGWSFGESGELS